MRRDFRGKTFGQTPSQHTPELTGVVGPQEKPPWLLPQADSAEDGQISPSAENPRTRWKRRSPQAPPKIRPLEDGGNPKLTRKK